MSWCLTAAHGQSTAYGVRGIACACYQLIDRERWREQGLKGLLAFKSDTGCWTRVSS